MPLCVSGRHHFWSPVTSLTGMSTGLLAQGSDQIADIRTPSTLRRHRWAPSGGYPRSKILQHLVALDHGGRKERSKGRSDDETGLELSRNASA
jgi:hypothetical protein